MGRERGDLQRRALMKQTLDELLPDLYTIYKQQAESYDALGLPVKGRKALIYEGSTLIPCRLQEYRVARDSRETIGPDLTQDLHEIVAPVDAPLYVNHIIVIGANEYEVTKVNFAAEYSPYVSAIVVSLGKVRNN